MTPETYISSFDLNQITTKRASLTFEEAIAVWLMRWNGDTIQIIAARFGTNQGRVADVLTEKEHAGSKAAAFSLRSG
ncbi:hypothetical protein KUV51_00075 [Tateyamaria omphalii]|uniref:hypothetical protein n=1 Tax=Tateyamaria omphalii TaxID=299262 RepID=UPI001C99C556|nr:hypothetical protein [Tateyamaria omphalii]MBY5931377.1 hypothetical protein [Tateyamaria omphalii]